MQKIKEKKVLVLCLALLVVLAVVLAVVFLRNPGKSQESAGETVQPEPTGQGEPIGQPEPTEEPEEEESPKDIPIRGAIPADKPAFVVSGTKAKAGDKQVEVIIDVVNNPGIMGMDFDLYYDDTALTLVEAQSLLDVEGCEYTPAAYYKNPTTFLWDFQDTSWAQDGAVLKLLFDIAEDAPAGKYEIKIMYSYGNVFGEDLEPVDMGVKNGNISIS